MLAPETGYFGGPEWKNAGYFLESLNFHRFTFTPGSAHPFEKTRPLKKTLLQCFKPQIVQKQSVHQLGKGNPVQKKGQYRGQASGERQKTTKLQNKTKKCFAFVWAKRETG